MNTMINLNNLRMLFSAIILSLVITSSAYSDGSGSTGGGEIKLIKSQNMANYILDDLKSDLIKTITFIMDIVVDPEDRPLKAELITLLDDGLLEDINTKDNYDIFNKVCTVLVDGVKIDKEASAKYNDFGGIVCWAPVLIATNYKEAGGVPNNLLEGLAFHEHAHHFALKDETVVGHKRGAFIAKYSGIRKIEELQSRFQNKIPLNKIDMTKKITVKYKLPVTQTLGDIVGYLIPTTSATLRLWSGGSKRIESGILPKSQINNKTSKKNGILTWLGGYQHSELIWTIDPTHFDNSFSQHHIEIGSTMLGLSKIDGQEQKTHMVISQEGKTLGTVSSVVSSEDMDSYRMRLGDQSAYTYIYDGFQLDTIIITLGI